MRLPALHTLCTSCQAGIGGWWASEASSRSLKLRKREALRLLSLPRAQREIYLSPVGLRKADFLRSEAEWDWWSWDGREGRRNRALGKGGWFSVPLDLQNIHRKEYCTDNITTTTTHPLPMSTPSKLDLQSSSQDTSKIQIRGRFFIEKVDWLILEGIFIF